MVHHFNTLFIRRENRSKRPSGVTATQPLCGARAVLSVRVYDPDTP